MSEVEEIELEIERAKQKYTSYMVDMMTESKYIAIHLKNHFDKKCWGGMEEEAIKAWNTRSGDEKGLIIKKYIMTLPMDIRRAIMKHDSEVITKEKEVNNG